jgi:hypothetical protein
MTEAMMALRWLRENKEQEDKWDQKQNFEG